jgi:NADH:ubiquinone oxidoreductase subunit H
MVSQLILSSTLVKAVSQEASGDILASIILFFTLNLEPILKILILPGLAFILVFAIIAVWFERKFLARAILRVGPYYCGGRSGVLQVFADFLKLFP